MIIISQQESCLLFSDYYYSILDIYAIYTLYLYFTNINIHRFFLNKTI